MFGKLIIKTQQYKSIMLLTKQPELLSLTRFKIQTADLLRSKTPEYSYEKLIVEVTYIPFFKSFKKER